TPTLVVGPSIGPVAPPSIIVGLFVEMPETVNEPTVDKTADPFPLHGQKAGNILVPNGIVDVDGLMTDVIVPAHDQVGTLFTKFIGIFLKIGHVHQFMVQSGQVGS